MRKQDVGFDYLRYHRLLSEAVDEDKRLALIELLIEEKARDRLAAQRASESCRDDGRHDRQSAGKLAQLSLPRG